MIRHGLKSNLNIGWKPMLIPTSLFSVEQVVLTILLKDGPTITTFNSPYSAKLGTHHGPNPHMTLDGQRLLQLWLERCLQKQLTCFPSLAQIPSGQSAWKNGLSKKEYLSRVFLCLKKGLSDSPQTYVKAIYCSFSNGNLGVLSNTGFQKNPQKSL